MKVYIACGLTHVPRSEFASYVDFIHGLASYLERAGKLVKYALRDSDPQLATKPFADRARLCYFWDKEMVDWADVVVAEASYPAIGVGIELQIAQSKETPILLMFRLVEAHRAVPVKYKTLDTEVHDLQLGQGYVSLMALGLPAIFKVQPYASVEDAYETVDHLLSLLGRVADDRGGMN